MDYDLEKLEPYLEFFDKIADKDVGMIEKCEFMMIIGSYDAQRKDWEKLKKEGYQLEKKTVKRQYEAELEKQINITRKFLIRLDHDLPEIELMPKISEKARSEVIGYLHALEEIDMNKEINRIFNNEKPGKKAIELHIREVFRKYNIIGIDKTLRELLPQI